METHTKLCMLCSYQNSDVLLGAIQDSRRLSEKALLISPKSGSGPTFGRVPEAQILRYTEKIILGRPPSHYHISATISFRLPLTVDAHSRFETWSSGSVAGPALRGIFNA